MAESDDWNAVEDAPKRTRKAPKEPLFEKRWQKPPQEFIDWWAPIRFDPILGSIGGHEEAYRAHPHRTIDGKMLWCGAHAATAWNCRQHREEFREFQKQEIMRDAGYGTPRPPPYQATFFKDPATEFAKIKALLANVNKNT